MSGRTHYTAKEDNYLVEYIARTRPTLVGRLGNEIYKALVDDEDRWPWGQRHTWQSWRERYKSNKSEFDVKIGKYQRRNGGVEVGEEDFVMMPSQRNGFTMDEDKLLVKYLARYNPQIRGRSGNDVYKMLVENAEGKWSWSKTHTWHSWRYRYVSNQEEFDRKIHKYQQQHNIQVPPIPKRPPKAFRDERLVKRPKFAEEKDSQETQWAKINWPTPRKDDGQGRMSDWDGERGEGRKVKEEEKVEVKVPKREEGDVVWDEDDHDDEDGEDDDAKPPDSDDYVGDIFQDADEEKDGDHEDQLMSDVEEDGNADEDSEAVLNGHLDVNVNIQTEQGAPGDPLHTQGQPESEQDPVTKAEPISPEFPPKPSQPKFRGNVNHNDFTLASQSRRQLNEDPFEDEQPSLQHELKLPVSKKQLPKLVETVFGNKFNGVRGKKVGDSLTEDSDGEVEVPWPPRRGMRGQKDGIGVKEKDDLERQAVVEQRRKEKGKGKAVEPDDDSAAVVEPSEERRDSTCHPPPMKPQPQIPEAGPSRITTAKRRQTDIFAPPTPQFDTLQSKRHSTGTMIDSTTPQMNVIPTHTGSSSSRTINLRQELAQRQLHQPIRRASSRASHTSSIISEEDNQVFQQLGIQLAIRMLSEEFGFTEVVVQKLWNELRSLRLLREALTEMKESAERALSEYVEGPSMISNKTGKSPGSGVKSKRKTTSESINSTPVTVVSVNATTGSSTRPSRKSNSGGGRKSLEIKPVDIMDADMELEYEPLSGTRAGKYTRLAKMGREDEALEREQRRVSSIALSPIRNMSQQERYEEQEPREDEGLEQDDGEGEEIEIEIQDEDSDEEKDAQMLPVDGDVHEGGRIDGQEDQAMEVDTRSPEARRQKTTQNDPTPNEERHRDTEPQDEQVGESQKVNGHQYPAEEAEDHEPETVEEDEDEEIISIKSESSEIDEVDAMIRSDTERWKEVEHLFRAANRHNVKSLRDLEKKFKPEFLMGWLGNQVILK